MKNIYLSMFVISNLFAKTIERQDITADFLSISRNNAACHDLSKQVQSPLEGYVVNHNFYYQDKIIDVSNQGNFDELFSKITSTQGSQILKLKLTGNSLQNKINELLFEINDTIKVENVSKFIKYFLQSRASVNLQDSDLDDVFGNDAKGSIYDVLKNNVEKSNETVKIEESSKFYYFDDSYDPIKEYDFDFKAVSGVGNLCAFNSIIEYFKVNEFPTPDGENALYSVAHSIASRNGTGVALRDYFAVDSKEMLELFQNGKTLELIKSYIAVYLNNNFVNYGNNDLGYMEEDFDVENKINDNSPHFQIVYKTLLKNEKTKKFAEEMRNKDFIGYEGENVEIFFSTILTNATMSSDDLIKIITNIMEIPLNVLFIDTLVGVQDNQFKLKFMSSDDKFKQEAMNVLLHSQGKVYSSVVDHYSLLLSPKHNIINEIKLLSDTIMDEASSLNIKDHFEEFNVEDFVLKISEVISKIGDADVSDLRKEEKEMLSSFIEPLNLDDLLTNLNITTNSNITVRQLMIKTVPDGLEVLNNLVMSIKSEENKDNAESLINNLQKMGDALNNLINTL